MSLRLFIGLFLFAGALCRLPGAEPIRFSRDILPILSDRCFNCHGPDETHRQADLRLDVEDSVLQQRGDHAVVVPGDLQASELIARITSRDADLQMPPPDSGREPLSKQEQDLLQRWIKQGAAWGQHWAFEKPIRPEIDNMKMHPIDFFVQRQLKQHKMRPANPAAKNTLMRRLSLDLIGLPPTLEELRAFEKDDSPEAYVKLVSRLLASKHYGERMAMWWLDAARYSDTDGYQGDATRNNWPWRDWVVTAFNNNMPFDQFTVEQFAGDLLPAATPEQILATCFHRNHMTNGEGGRLPEESRIDYVIDRVNTTGTVWLGLTLGCAQCHSHKFDPISQTDYYSLFAFFDNIDEDGRAGGAAKPYLKYTSPFAARAVTEAQQLVTTRSKREVAVRQAAEDGFDEWLRHQVSDVQSGFKPWHVMQPTKVDSVEGTQFVTEDDGTVQTTGPHPRQDDYHVMVSPALKRITGLRLEVLPHASHTAGKLTRGTNGEFIITDVKLQVLRQGDSQIRDIELLSAIATAEMNVGGRNYGRVSGTLDDDPRNGWTTQSHDPLKSYTAVFALTQPLVLEPDETLRFVMLHRSTVGDANTGRFRIALSDQVGRAVRSFDKMPLEQLANARVARIENVPAEIRAALLEQFLSDQQGYQTAKLHLDRAKSQLAAAKKTVAPQNVMVLAERKTPRTTFVLERGVWDKKGLAVTADVPESILAHQSAVANEPPGRLDLAKWLVSTEHPLTARVLVNQLWQLCFGAGLVRTPEDFGLQGERPTHPELLDYLALEFMESGWDVQHVLRLIVTSRTYRQSSEFVAAAIDRDPDNRWLARGARFRLPSWMIRDGALRSSGLLNDALGGPTVMPYQPDGVWAEMFMGRFRYQPSQGAAQYRRTLYAFWRRSAAPTFLFDSSQRRICEVRPRQTNTPLQALTMLNDLNIMTSARNLAKNAMAQQSEVSQQLEYLFEAVLCRRPDRNELTVLAREYDAAMKHYGQGEVGKKQAVELLRFGQPEQYNDEQVIQVPSEDSAKLASLLIVASLIYNLDEAVTHE
ncbi:MAG: PSD1 and planctomycete cytochrome C domain-containing protein [Pirellulaceae bacterium]